MNQNVKTTYNSGVRQLFTSVRFKIEYNVLTHGGLVTSYGVIDLCQDCFGQQLVFSLAPSHYQDMMTSSNGNIFRLTGPWCGEFIGDRWIPRQRPVTPRFGVFFDLRLVNGWVNNGEAGDLRRNRAHYDVSVMINPGWLSIGPLSVNFIAFQVKMPAFVCKKFQVKMSSAKCRQFCSCRNMLACGVTEEQDLAILYCHPFVSTKQHPLTLCIRSESCIKLTYFANSEISLEQSTLWYSLANLCPIVPISTNLTALPSLKRKCKFSSLATSLVLKFTTLTRPNFANMTTFPFQWYESNLRKHIDKCKFESNIPKIDEPWNGFEH